MRFCLTIENESNVSLTRMGLSDILLGLSIRILGPDDSGEVRNTSGVSVGSWELRPTLKAKVIQMRSKPRMYDSEEDVSCYTEMPEKY